MKILTLKHQKYKEATSIKTSFSSIRKNNTF